MWIELTEVCISEGGYRAEKILLNTACITSIRRIDQESTLRYGCYLSSDVGCHQIKESYEDVRKYFLDQVQKSISVVNL